MLITSNMVRNSIWPEIRGFGHADFDKNIGKGMVVHRMEEKTYKTMGGAGALNITVGVVALVAGIASGVLLIISGAKLLAGRNKILF